VGFVLGLLAAALRRLEVLDRLLEQAAGAALVSGRIERVALGLRLRGLCACEVDPHRAGGCQHQLGAGGAPVRLQLAVAGVIDQPLGLALWSVWA